MSAYLFNSNSPVASFSTGPVPIAAAKTNRFARNRGSFQCRAGEEKWIFVKVFRKIDKVT